MPNGVVDHIGSVVAAIGALGLASFALVDATKIGRKGGVSHSGFPFIERAVQKLLPKEKLTPRSADQKAPRTVLDILHANWIGGAPSADQKAIAKSLIKLRLSSNTAKHFADATDVSPEVLEEVAEKMRKGDSLTSEQSNALGRFDLALTAILDEGYQRADQKYRNTTRVLASAVAVILAVLGWWAVTGSVASKYFGSSDMFLAALCGLLATPLAPISKDLTSALQAGVKLAQTLKK